MCTTSAANAYPSFHVTTACAAGGSGSCDGYCYDHDSAVCTCSCHSSMSLPDTVEGVKRWHDLEYYHLGSKDERALVMRNLCDNEFGAHDHDPRECSWTLDQMLGDDGDYPIEQDYPSYDPQTAHYERFGNIAAPNEY